MSEQQNLSGGCQCGAVRFELAQRPAEYGACHCNMCRKIGGGVALSFMVPGDGLTWTAQDTLKTYTSSQWAERGFCTTCGSSLFWRLTAPGPMHGLLSVSVSALDNMDGIPFNSEVYIDHKPDSYAFAGERNRMTEADVMAMVSAGQPNE